MKLTIDKFQRLQAIANLDDNELEKASKLVQVLVNKSSEDVDKMSLKKFGKLCEKLKDAFDLDVNAASKANPSKYIYANKKYYKLNFEIKPPFNTGRYIEVLTFSKDDPINNMHNILASICTPIKWSWAKFRFIDLPYDVLSHESYADDMKKADFKHGYNAMVFFYLLLASSTSNMLGYSEMKMIMRRGNKKRAEQLREILLRLSDGYSTQNK